MIFKIILALFVSKLCMANRLIEAINSGNIEEAQTMLKDIDEEDLNEITLEYETPLSLAIKNGYTDLAIKILETNEINLKPYMQYDEYTPDGKLNTIRIKAKRKINLNYLIYALLLKREKIAMKLVNIKEIEVNNCIDITEDALKYISKILQKDEDDKEAMKRLTLEHVLSGNYNTALSLAIINSYDDIAMLILNRNDIDLSISLAESNYLVLALKLNKKDLANSILDRSFTLFEEDKDRALDLNRDILKKGKLTSTLLEVINLSKDNEMTFKIIEHPSFRVNDQIDGLSYLNYAIIENNEELALKLIKDIRIKIDLMSKGLTPLMQIAIEEEPNLNILNIILEKEPNIWKKSTIEDEDFNGQNVLCIAAIQANVSVLSKILDYIKTFYEEDNNKESYYSSRIKKNSPKTKIDIIQELRYSLSLVKKYNEEFDQDIENVIDILISEIKYYEDKYNIM